MNVDQPVPRVVGRSAVPFSAAVPGSKSQTCRALLLAAMRPGRTRVVGGLHADDTRRLAAALAAFPGLSVDVVDDGFVVQRSVADLAAPALPLDLGGGGTPARLLLPFAALARGATVVTGDARLRERPMADLVEALRALGIRCEYLDEPGRLPVRVHGGVPTTRRWRVGVAASSQFASALALLASQLPGPPIEIDLDGPLVSAPYLDLTLAMLVDAGVPAGRRGSRVIVTPAPVVAATIRVEPDASSAAYFLALAAVTGTTVLVAGLAESSRQADVRFADVLARMGCRVAWRPDGLQLTGAALGGIDADLLAMPDQVLTLAAVALTARGATRIRGLATLRGKESDRVATAIAGVTALGGSAQVQGEDLVIEPGPLRAARIEPHGDHRVAMAFAVPGVLVDGVVVADGACVDKSFPGFWSELRRFGAHHAPSSCSR